MIQALGVMVGVVSQSKNVLMHARAMRKLIIAPKNIASLHSSIREVDGAIYMRSRNARHLWIGQVQQISRRYTNGRAMLPPSGKFAQGGLTLMIQALGVMVGVVSQSMVVRMHARAIGKLIIAPKKIASLQSSIRQVEGAIYMRSRNARHLWMTQVQQ